MSSTFGCPCYHCPFALLWLADALVWEMPPFRCKIASLLLPSFLRTLMGKELGWGTEEAEGKITTMTNSCSLPNDQDTLGKWFQSPGNAVPRARPVEDAKQGRRQMAPVRLLREVSSSYPHTLQPPWSHCQAFVMCSGPPAMLHGRASLNKCYDKCKIGHWQWSPW
jgi:hypothetical protein